MLPFIACFFFSATALAIKCDLGNPCPKSTPCCSQYGECGVGAFCLGGCDPRSSFKLDACVPAPVCSDKKIKFDKFPKNSVNIKDYLGDASKADWMVQGETVQWQDSTLMTMAKNTPGTVLASTEYMWYGNVKATMKTSRGRGVITAFILLSDVKDEIDYEWVGADLETSQTNYYFQGVKDYTHSKNISTQDTFGTWHDYEIRWTPDKIEWLVDGETHRTKERKDTWNSTSQSWMFPQTPARVQLSIWPGGNPDNGEGTIQWAGGVISWDHPDIKNNGYYYAAVKEVDIKCYNADTAPGTNKGKSYIFNDAKATNDTVQDTNKNTVIGSLLATGLEMDKGRDDKPKNSQGSIPGGENPGIANHDTGSSPKQQQQQQQNPVSCSPTVFSQDCDGDSTAESSKTGGQSVGSQTQASSILAMIIAAAALVCL